MSPLLKEQVKLKFLLDENIDVRLSSFLKKRGFSVLTSPKGLKNGAVIELARKESCVLLTNDKDFVSLESSKLSGAAGVIVFRIHPPTLTKLEAALEKFLKKTTVRSLSDKTFLLSEMGFEIRE